jgi:general nucleoside transport system ATP-binding protein
MLDPNGIGRPRLDLVDLSRGFPGVIAVDSVSLQLAAGEIHALLGENGAGKSTLVKMIYGMLQPDTGTMQFEGQPYAPRTPSEARDVGVGMVFQHFSVFEALTVAENVALGLPRQLADLTLQNRILDVSRAYGLDVDPTRIVGTLSAGERQRIEIVRCLLQNPRLIIMDEPTSVLTPIEAARLFETLHLLATEGRTVLYISHKLDEIRALCQRATILRNGRVVGRCDPRGESAKSLAEMMIGATLPPPQRPALARQDTRLRVQNLSSQPATPFGVTLDNINFEVSAGEIFGIAGIAGNGQDELMAMLIGEQLSKTADTIRIDETPIGLLGPRARRQCGMAFVPEERLGHGAIPSASLTENMLLATTARGILNWRALRTSATEVVTRFGVRTASADSFANSLSGGNLQKFIVGREISQSPKVFIAAQPTWGVDAGAAALVHAELTALARAGAAIVLVSQDLDELFVIAHRIAVIAGGKVSRAQPVDAVTAESLGREMGTADYA